MRKKQIATRKGYTVLDIKKASCNLEPTICRHCKSIEASYNQYGGFVSCANCGLNDDGSNLKRQIQEQEVKPCEQAQ